MEVVDDSSSPSHSQNSPKRRLACASSGSTLAHIFTTRLQEVLLANQTSFSSPLHPTTNIKLSPPETKTNHQLLFEKYLQWPAERENHLVERAPEGRAATIVERSSRATPARQDSRLVLRKALFSICRGIAGRLEGFRGLVRWWIRRYLHPAVSRHPHKQRQNGRK